MIRSSLLVVIALVLPARAETIVLPDTQATLQLDPSWRSIVAKVAPSTGGSAPGLVAAYRGDRGELLAITRAQVPNIDAWRSKTRDAYVDEIERGVASRIPSYRRTRRQLVDVQGVPALDLEARRKHGATVVIRVLLFRTYALALAIELPRKRPIAAARAIASSFRPPAPPVPTPPR